MAALRDLKDLISHAWFPPVATTTSFAGLTILITGANTGVGYEAAHQFLSLGASLLIIAVRSLSKGEDAKRSLEKRTGRTGVIEVWQLDMLSYPSITAFASRINNELDRLDIAILNAGVFMTKYVASPYGWESTLQVNTLSTVLLALLLLPKLQSSRTETHTPVLELISSGRHRVMKMNETEAQAAQPMDLYNDPATFKSGRQYQASKLLLMCALPYLCELTSRSHTSSSSSSASSARKTNTSTSTSSDIRPAAEPEIIITSVCPGATRSSLSRGVTDRFWYLYPLFWVIFTIFLRRTEHGARSYVSGALTGREGHGKMWQHDRFSPTAPLLEGEEGEERMKRVWDEILETLQRDVPEITDVIRR